MKIFFTIAILALGLSHTAQASMDGCWKITHTAGVTVHESTLAMDGDDGTMITSYYDEDEGETVHIQQTMRLVPSARGVHIQGYSPTDVNTGRRVPDYAADNFYLSVSPSGDYDFYTYDDAGQISHAEVSYEECS